MRPPLNRGSVVSAGCELARRDGLESIRVRSVAGTLGVTPMALYRHVTDAQDLRDAVLAHFCRSLPARPESIDDLRRWAHEFRAWLLATPGLSRVVLTTWCELPAVLDVVESLLAVFHRVGLEGFDLVAAANSLFSYVLARGELEEAVRESGVRRSLPWAQDEVEHPLLHSMRDEYAVARLDEHFDFGLRLVLSGLLDRVSGHR